MNSKTIVILSTEPWGKMLLSKMHYAVAMQRMGSSVMFVNPPSADAKGNKIEIIQDKDTGIHIITIRRIRYTLFLRHKFFPLYNFLIQKQIKQIRKLIGKNIEQVWNFNPNSFPDTKAFKSKKNLLLLYDFFRGKHIELASKKADMVLAPADVIVEYYKKFNNRTYFLQHGLSKIFAEKNEKKNQHIHLPFSQRNDRVKVCYSGNLLIPSLDITLMEQVIKDYTQVDFHFFGPYSVFDNNVTDTNELIAEEREIFIKFLKKAENVKLHGVVSQNQLATCLQEMDIFLILYNESKDLNVGSNSHKMLEYLSTGKVIVGTLLSTYAGTGLAEMANGDSFYTLFANVLENLDEYNSLQKQQSRIRYALAHTYDAQIEKIQRLLYST